MLGVKGLGFRVRDLGLGLRFSVKVYSSCQCTTTSSGVLIRKKKLDVSN